MDGAAIISMPVYQEGETPGGVRYRIVCNEGDPNYNVRYIGGPSLGWRVRIEFDRPVAAVGADVILNGFQTLAPPNGMAGSASSLEVVESGYYGLIARSGAIREMTLVSRAEPFSITRLDIRPMPAGSPDTVLVRENSKDMYGSSLLLANDAYADGVTLEAPPLHADVFELYPDGSFLYHPAKNFQGEDSFMYRATNGGGTASSEPVTVSLHVLPVNSPPTFIKGTDVSCEEDAGLQTLPFWATSLSTGAEDETDQNLTWQIQVSNPELFEQQPALDMDGTLTFKPFPNATSQAHITVSLKDDGGLENGGVDTSASQTFTITVLPKADAPTLQAIHDCAVNLGDQLRITARASEADLESCIYYSLVKAPAGASIEPVSGMIAWTPSIADTGKVVEFEVRATASGLSSTVRFKAEVVAPLTAPVLDPIPNRFARPREQVKLQLRSDDEGARFALLKAPKGASLNPRTGKLFWKAPKTSAPGTYRFKVAVSDPDFPALSSVRSFSVRIESSIFLAKRPSVVARHSRARRARMTSRETYGQAAMVFAKPPRTK